MLTDVQLIIAFLFRHSNTFPGGILPLVRFSNHFHKMLRFAIPNWKQIQNNPKVSCNHFLNCFSKSDLLSRYLPPLPQPHNLRRWRKQGDVNEDDDDVTKEVMVTKLIAQMSLLDLTDGSPATHLMPNTLVGTGRWSSDLSLPSSPTLSSLSSSPSSPSPCVDTLSASYLATDGPAQVQTRSEVPRQERQRPPRLWQRLHHHRQPRQQVCCFHKDVSSDENHRQVREDLESRYRVRAGLENWRHWTSNPARTQRLPFGNSINWWASFQPRRSRSFRHYQLWQVLTETVQLRRGIRGA